MSLRADTQYIIDRSIEAVLPESAIRKALKGFSPQGGRVVLVACGKAAWRMANAANGILGDRISEGVVITKYDHSMGDIADFSIYEAGHPVPDENSFSATKAAIDAVAKLSEDDTVLFLLSGGASALFESPLCSEEELFSVTKQLLACGADITEMNRIRKRLSAVKGGRFAELCAPANVYSVILSDIIGDPVDMIASGPTCADPTTSSEAFAVVEKYKLNLSGRCLELMGIETPKSVSNAENHITGSVTQLCAAAEAACRELGYDAQTLTCSLNCEAREAGSFLAAIAREHADSDKPLAFIAGGETVVKLTGTGKGGRNQELSLSAAEGIAGINNAAVFSIGSDGTDGPTDAAGGYADGYTRERLLNKGISIPAVLADNDAYNALKACDGLIITGPTGTNVNDISVVLIDPKA